MHVECTIIDTHACNSTICPYICTFDHFIFYSCFVHAVCVKYEPKCDEMITSFARALSLSVHCLSGRS
jgi:hypothetical protein